MTSQQEVKKDFASMLLYIFGFLLLWEWLRPLEQLTDTGHLGIFLFFLMISLGLAYLNVRFIYAALIKCLYIFYFIHDLYIEGSFFGLKWIPVLVKDFTENMRVILSADWTSLSFIFKTLLFFILLWLMTYLIQYWLINRRQIFIFFFMTLVYITVLDTFTPYDADHAIVRTVIAGFAIMGMLTFFRLIDREMMRKERSFSKKWMLPLAVMIGFSVVVGYGAPKADPIWPDPVPYIKSYSNKSGNDGTSGVSRVGYGTDDTRLGGPFIGDNQVVYRTEVDNRHYWKVETKDIYTGKGWVSSQEGERTPFNQQEEVPFTHIGNSKPEEPIELSSHVFAYKSYPHIIYPLGVKEVQAPSASYSFEVETGLEKIYSLQTSRGTALEQFTAVYDKPDFSVKGMMATESLSEANLSEEFTDRYLSLPSNLPQRVKDLALEITEGKKTWFDKARAVERYFARSEFYYDQTNVLVPGPRDDYVDQFLFDSKRGYCDNFSSSMAVLLRSIEIPTRWVKGYTEGEFKGPAPENKRAFDITNNNAHSWVEVYFPEVGWVPFEPTKGFSNNVLFNYDLGSNQQTETETPEKEEAPETMEPDKQEDTTQTSSESFSFKNLWKDVKKFFITNWKKILLVLVIISLVAAFIYKTRLKWLPHYYIFRYKFMKKDDDIEKAYLILLKQFSRYGLKRKPDQTLREYAHYIDNFFSSKDMRKLTSSYEQYLYKGSLEKGRWEENKELWENLIKKTIA